MKHSEPSYLLYHLDDESSLRGLESVPHQISVALEEHLFF